jgi:hypothetical protein
MAGPRVVDDQALLKGLGCAAAVWSAPTPTI